VLFVGVRCTLDELEHRERTRADRRIGLAKQQYAIVHAHGVYDLDVDTSIYSPIECALQIKKVLEANINPRAFDRLAMRMQLP
jgi:chloramphenicol 3-O phosphotransferase